VLERRGLRVMIFEGISSGINVNVLERAAW
jgi:hypothetical protein